MFIFLVLYVLQSDPSSAHYLAKRFPDEATCKKAEEADFPKIVDIVHQSYPKDKITFTHFCKAVDDDADKIKTSF